MFLSLIQGLAFRFAIARLPVALAPEAERMLAMYLQTITAAADAVKRARRRPNTSIAAKKWASWRNTKCTRRVTRFASVLNLKFHRLIN